MRYPRLSHAAFVLLAVGVGRAEAGGLQQGTTFTGGSVSGITAGNAPTADAGVVSAMSFVTPPPLLYLAGAQSAGSQTNPVKAGQAFCMSATVTAQSALNWADNGDPKGGILQLGTTFGGNDSFSLYRTSNQNGSFLVLKLFDHTGGYHPGSAWSNATGPARFANASHQATGCYTPTGGLTIWIDGVLDPFATVAGSFTFVPPATLRVADLGSGAYAYGAGISNVCIAGPSGRSTGTANIDVLNSCGQFTPTYTGPCLGCIAPALASPGILAIGDSITFGAFETARPWPSRLQALIGPGVSIVNGAVSGDTVSQMRTIYDTSYHHSGMFNRCIFLGGVNDIFQLSSSAATAYSAASALLDEMRTDGCAPMIVQSPPQASSSWWTAGKQTEYDTYWTDLLGYCSTYSLVCVPTYAALGNGATPPAYASPYGNQDNVHPSQQGEDLLASLVYWADPDSFNAMNALPARATAVGLAPQALPTCGTKTVWQVVGDIASGPPSPADGGLGVNSRSCICTYNSADAGYLWRNILDPSSMAGTTTACPD